MAGNQVSCRLFETHAGFCIACNSEQLKVMFVGYFFCLVFFIPHGTVELLIHTEHADPVKDTLCEHGTSTCVLSQGHGDHWQSVHWLRWVWESFSYPACWEMTAWEEVAGEDVWLLLLRQGRLQRLSQGCRCFAPSGMENYLSEAV